MLMVEYEMVVVDRADDTGLRTYLLVDVEKTETGKEVAGSILDCLWARNRHWHQRHLRELIKQC